MPSHKDVCEAKAIKTCKAETEAEAIKTCKETAIKTCKAETPCMVKCKTKYPLKYGRMSGKKATRSRADCDRNCEDYNYDIDFTARAAADEKAAEEKARKVEERNLKEAAVRNDKAGKAAYDARAAEQKKRYEAGVKAEAERKPSVSTSESRAERAERQQSESRAWHEQEKAERVKAEKAEQQEQISGAKAHFYGQGQNVIAEAAYGDAFAPYMGVMGRGQPHTFGQIGIGSSGMNESIDSALMVSVLGALALLIALCTMILLCCVGCVIGWFGARRFQFGNAKTTTDAMANMDPFYQEARVQSDVV